MCSESTQKYIDDADLRNKWMSAELRKMSRADIESRAQKYIKSRAQKYIESQAPDYIDAYRAQVLMLTLIEQGRAQKSIEIRD